MYYKYLGVKILTKGLICCYLHALYVLNFFCECFQKWKEQVPTTGSATNVFVCFFSYQKDPKTRLRQYAENEQVVN